MKAHLDWIGKTLIIVGTLFVGSVLSLTAGVYLYLSPKLPSAETLRTVQLQTPLRIYTRDHQLIAEFGEKRRSPVAFEDIPPSFIHAILAAEDDNFYRHSGVDPTGLLRAATELVLTGSIQSGGSTITMQVARNFFLTAEQSFIRKFNEILLAFRIEDDLSKDEILTLYANKIYLGNRAYGIEAAARVYYGKSVDELALHQIAMIAGLPKAPSKFNPLSNLERAVSRRNWILGRMHKLGYIDQQQYDDARQMPDDASYHSANAEIDAPYVAEMVRQEAIQRWGLDAYTEGYIITTSLDSQLQQAANAAMFKGLEAYDWRHGYRGAEKTIDDPSAWQATLEEVSPIHHLQPAIVAEVSPEQALLRLRDGAEGTLALADNSVRRFITEDRYTHEIEDLTEILKTGDLIRVKKSGEDAWLLSQIPKVQGALVSIDPENGAIRALVGGYSFATSNFNRANQAIRQPGSNFKPFVYTRALEKGMSPATLINDAPIVFRDPDLEDVWRPENDSGKFYGPTPLRTALYRSRNVVSVRLLRQIGVNYAVKSMSRFGFDESELPKNLSLALGTLGTTPLTIAQAYTVFANGGYKVEAHLMDRVETIDGELIFQANPATVCRHCDESGAPATVAEADFQEADSLQDLFGTDSTEGNNTDPIVNPAERIVDARIAYMMDSILRDVIKKGTGTKAQALERNDIGGKTGTTNGPRDAWFSGYSPHLVTTVWVGFDENLPLGRNEYGGSAALPIWIDYMEVALEGLPEIHRPQPPGLVTVKINPATGKRASPGEPGVFEFFLKENAPRLPGRSYSNSGSATGGALPDDLF